MPSLAERLPDMGRTPELPRQGDFYEAIGKSWLREIITPQTPYGYDSLEFALSGYSTRGGLGILAGDMILQAEKNGVNMVGTTLGYTSRWEQRINRDTLEPYHVFDMPAPHDQNSRKEAEVTIGTNGATVKLDVNVARNKYTTMVSLTEPGLFGLYQKPTEDEHRLYQLTVLGFGGQKAWDALGIKPAAKDLNESPTVFSALAYFDSLLKQGLGREKALQKTGEIYFQTNHTLVAAVDSAYPEDWLKKHISPNLSPEAKSLFEGLIQRQGGRLNLDTLVFELLQRFNGVSQLQAKIASESFKKADGSPVKYEPITNGIFLPRWANPHIYDFYQNSGIIDRFDLVQPEYESKIDVMEYSQMAERKQAARMDLRKFLATEAIDQYGNHVQIPNDAIALGWSRRMADYKRPDALFYDPDRLAQILEANNMHLNIAGDVHVGDKPMIITLHKILKIIDQNPTLKKRVHYLQGRIDEQGNREQGYTVRMGQMLTRGSDVWLNTPEVGKEACGTSGWKAVVNEALLISAIDGGFADKNPPVYIPITGKTNMQEIQSLYAGLEQAATILRDPQQWEAAVKNQLKTYLPTISGGEMLKRYLEFVFSHPNQHIDLPLAA